MLHRLGEVISAPRDDLPHGFLDLSPIHSDTFALVFLLLTVLFRLTRQRCKDHVDLLSSVSSVRRSQELIVFDEYVEPL